MAEPENNQNHNSQPAASYIPPVVKRVFARFVGLLGVFACLLFLYPMLWLALMASLLQMAIFIFTGKKSGDLHKFTVKTVGYFLHSFGYIFLLIDDPPFPFGDYTPYTAESIKEFMSSTGLRPFQESKGKPANQASTAATDSTDGETEPKAEEKKEFDLDSYTEANYIETKAEAKPETIAETKEAPPKPETKKPTKSTSTARKRKPASKPINSET